MGRPSTLPKILEALRAIESTRTRQTGLSQSDLQERTGVSAGAVCDHLKALHARRLVHIASWKTDGAGGAGGGVYQARYRLGDSEDAPKPPPLTKAEIGRRYVARAKRNGTIDEIRARAAAAEKGRYWDRKGPRRDPLVAALFGPAS